MRKGQIRDMLKPDAPNGAGRDEDALAAWSYRAEKNSDAVRHRATGGKMNLPSTGKMKLHSTD